MQKTPKSFTNPKTFSNPKLAGLFTEDRFGHAALIPLGEGTSQKDGTAQKDGAALKIRYRAGSDAITARVREYLLAQFSALGFDPEVAINALGGKVPTGEDGAQFEEAFQALGESGPAEIENALTRSSGYELTQIVGSWIQVSGKIEEPLGEMTPDDAALLPNDVKRAIFNLSKAATIPVESLDFFAASPRS